MKLHVSIAMIGGVADMAVSQLHRVSTVRANIVVLPGPSTLDHVYIQYIGFR